MVTCRVAGKGRRASRAAPWGRPEVRRCPGPMPDSRRQALRAPAVVELRDDPGGRHWCGRPVPSAAQPHKGRPEGRPGRASGRSGAGEQPRHLRFCRAPSRERSSLEVHGKRGHRRLGRGVLGGAPTAPPAAAAPGPGSGRTGWGGEPLSAAAVSSAVVGLRSPRAEGKASGFDPARRGGGTSACAHGARAPPRAPEVCSLILFLRENPRTSCGPRQIKIPKYSSCRLGNGISAPPGRAEPVPAATPSTPGDVLSVGEQAGAWPAGPPGGVRSRHLRRLPTGSLEGCVFCWICKPRACVWVCGDFSS